jgi:hypothetical protein
VACTNVMTHPRVETQAGIEQDLAFGQLIYDLRIEAGLSQSALTERMGTTPVCDLPARRAGELGIGSTLRPASPLASKVTSSCRSPRRFSITRRPRFTSPDRNGVRPRALVGKKSPRDLSSVISVAADAWSRPIYN